MVNIVVSQNKNVTGDTGKIIAYEGSEYSEVINIVHPIFQGVQYFIEYKYDNTILRNELDSNNHVSIKVTGAGYVKCQFVALDLVTGDAVFKSNYWYFIVKESLKVEPSHYPCHSAHYYKHRPPMFVAGHHKPNNDENVVETIAKLSVELSNEEDIRFNEIQSLRQEIAEIKAYVGIDDVYSSTLNADEIVTPGSYKASAQSTGFPETNKEYTLTVSLYGDESVLQHAYEIDSNNVYYRSTISSTDIAWSEWTLMAVQS